MGWFRSWLSKLFKQKDKAKRKDKSKKKKRALNKVVKLFQIGQLINLTLDDYPKAGAVVTTVVAFSLICSYIVVLPNSGSAYVASTELSAHFASYTSVRHGRVRVTLERDFGNLLSFLAGVIVDDFLATGDDWKKVSVGLGPAGQRDVILTRLAADLPPGLLDALADSGLFFIHAAARWDTGTASASPGVGLVRKRREHKDFVKKACKVADDFDLAETVRSGPGQPSGFLALLRDQAEPSLEATDARLDITNRMSLLQARLTSALLENIAAAALKIHQSDEQEPTEINCAFAEDARLVVEIDRRTADNETVQGEENADSESSSSASTSTSSSSSSTSRSSSS